MKTFGAYVHARPDGRIFYVGKGTEKRARNLQRNNQHYTNITSKYGKENILVGFIPCSSEATAFALEVGLIKCLRRANIALVNRTNGGEGAAGAVLSDAVKMKISLAHKGRTHTPEARANMSKAHIGNRHTQATRAKMGKSRIGGKITEETRAKRSKARASVLALN